MNQKVWLCSALVVVLVGGLCLLSLQLGGLALIVLALGAVAVFAYRLL